MLSGLASNGTRIGAGRVRKSSRDCCPVRIHILGSIQCDIQGEGKEANLFEDLFLSFFLLCVHVLKRGKERVPLESRGGVRPLMAEVTGCL